MQGLHLTADLSGCHGQRVSLTDPQALRELCVAHVTAAGLQPVAELFHRFEASGAGVTGVVLLAESHLALHTWPELKAVTLDAYVCNFGGDNSAKAHALIEALVDAFEPEHVDRQRLERGR
ncbi:MAG TPA: adenosylmethionine decarboxylase [Burkholderiaceae bacterium]|nr:adenosylmethionine decarboxylase [Burkholderiaceae bacterium]